MNVLITGCAGFLGSHLVNKLLDNGDYVIGVDNLFRGKESNIQKPLSNTRFKFIKGDLTEQQCIVKINKEVERVGGLDYIYHYAAVNGTEHFYDKPSYTFYVNNKSTENILNVAELNRNRLKRFMYTSSSEVYGEPRIIPTPESELISLNINADRDSYAASKANTEFMVRLRCKELDIHYTILRPFNTYGPNMDDSKYGQVVPEFFRKVMSDDEFTIIGSGKETRSFCYVSDHIEMAVMSAMSENTINGIFNIGIDNEISIIELARKVHDVVGARFNSIEIEGRKDDIQRRSPDISKITNAIGYAPSISLLDGLRLTFEAQFIE